MKCVAGCKAFTGGEIYHHKDCTFYPESMSKMYDDLKAANDSTTDLKFLKEMHGLTQSLINAKYDITVVQYLDKMIEDWIDEISRSG